MLELKEHLIDEKLGKLELIVHSKTWLARLSWLPVQERTMLEFALTGRATNRELARLTGLSAGSINRRIQRYRARLGYPVVKQLCNPDLPLHPQLREIALKRYLLGQPIKVIARSLNKTPSCVRQDLVYVEGYLAALSRRGHVTLDAN